jgi:dinuclear metal center YbgI/SA1388 family protein
MPRCRYLSHALKALESEAVACSRWAAKWDNVGLLVDSLAVFDAASAAPFRVLFTNDVTPAVLAEAVAKRAGLLVAYHPTPFAALKKVHGEAHGPGAVILTLARAGCALYSPHTSLDVAPGGLNDWLALGVAAALPGAGAAAGDGASGGGGGGGSGAVSLAAVRPSDDPALAAAGGGDGRVARLAAPATLADLVAAVKAHCGISAVQVALPSAAAAAGAGAASVPVRSFAVCAGSGASVLAGCRADAWVTGELGHHDVLAAAAAGTAVVLTNHSNCERGFLRVLMQRFRKELATLEAAEAGAPHAASYECLLSEADADPLFVM